MNAKAFILMMVYVYDLLFFLGEQEPTGCAEIFIPAMLGTRRGKQYSSIPTSSPVVVVAVAEAVVL